MALEWVWSRLSVFSTDFGALVAAKRPKLAARSGCTTGSRAKMSNFEISKWGAESGLGVGEKIALF